MCNRITDAVNRSDLSIGLYNNRKAVFYKHIPLWNCGSESIDKLDIYLAQHDGVVTYDFELVCEDEDGGYYYYGGWNTLQEAMAWLKHPTPYGGKRTHMSIWKRLFG